MSEHAKQELLNTLFAKYHDLLNFTTSFPMQHQMRINATTNLDQAMFWVREAIGILPD